MLPSDWRFLSSLSSALWIKFLCWAFNHEWTCNAAEGVQPTQRQRTSYKGYLEYATEWCKRCGATCEPGGFTLMFAELFFRRKSDEKIGRADDPRQLH